MLSTCVRTAPGLPAISRPQEPTDLPHPAYFPNSKAKAGTQPSGVSFSRSIGMMGQHLESWSASPGGSKVLLNLHKRKLFSQLLQHPGQVNSSNPKGNGAGEMTMGPGQRRIRNSVSMNRCSTSTHGTSSSPHLVTELHKLGFHFILSQTNLQMGLHRKTN